MSKLIYQNEKKSKISFPLGGLGTGCIGISGNGQFIDWEIFNRPNKGSLNGFSHFAIKAEEDGKVIDAKVINGDFLGDYTGRINHEIGFGRGIPKESMAGIPHFKDVVFEGEFPFAKLDFKDDSFPGNLNMMAFNPFIPSNDKDSTIPGAFFEIEVENTFDSDLDYYLCLTLDNPMDKYTGYNKFYEDKNNKYINLSSEAYDKNDENFGELTIGTDCEDVSYQEYWYRAIAFEKLETFWREFTSLGPLKNRSYQKGIERKKYGKKEGTDLASLCAHVKIEKNSKKKVRFVMTWNFPVAKNYWIPANENNTWKNYYAVLFEGSDESAKYAMENYKRLLDETKRFKDALFASTMPIFVKEAVSANISILKSPTVMRLEDGSFYGFEGSSVTGGSCEGSCSHVWNYEYALAFLFPKLEKSMRNLNLKYNLGEDNNLYFRLPLPLGREMTDYYKSFYACVDGQYVEIASFYREWKLSGDTKWLKSKWKDIKRGIEFAWNENNKHKWDPDKSGVISGRQHHTLDTELFGISPWLTGIYALGLKAGSEMAKALGYVKKSQEYSELADKAILYMDENLFNGEYFIQEIDLKDKSIIDTFGVDYWNEEQKEIKYQLKNACHIDQIIAQWHSDLMGLGRIFDKNKTKKTLESIYKYNFKKTMRDFYNPCRLFCVNDEKGTVIATWPDESKKQASPILYSGEAMNGFEYQVASHMILNGMVQEGEEIVKAIRERYDGEFRNPWNEFECGNNYVRSMASYALLIAYSGFKFDMTKNHIGFNPIKKDKYSYFWSIDGAWGTFSKELDKYTLKVLYGNMELNSINIEGKHIVFDEMKSISAGQEVNI